MKYIISIGIAGAVIAVGSWYLLQEGTDSSEQAVIETTPSDTTPQAGQVPPQGTGTFRDMLGFRGSSIVCEVSYVDPQSGASTAGTVYVSGDRMRGDFAMTILVDDIEEETNVSVIRDGNVSYVWGESPAGSMALRYTLDETEVDESGARTSDPFEYDTDVDYECRSWNADDDTLTPPGTIEFTDMSAQMETLENVTTQGGAGDVRSMQCAACDQAPEGAREQCRAALGC